MIEIRDVNIKIREVGLWAEQKWLILSSRNPPIRVLILRLYNILSHTTHNMWWHALNEPKINLQIGSLKFNRRWSKRCNAAAAVTWLQSTLRFLWILNVSFSTLTYGTGSVHHILGEGWYTVNWTLFNVGCKIIYGPKSCDFHSAPQSIRTITWHQLSNECTELILVKSSWDVTVVRVYLNVLHDALTCSLENEKSVGHLVGALWVT